MPTETLQAPDHFELRKVFKYFGDLAALQDVTLQIGKGESIFIYGPNGAGKTTLLRILSTLARPAEGDVLFAGRAIHSDPVPARRRTGFVSHQTFLYGDLTVRENLKLAATLFALSEPERRIAAALEMFSITHRAEDQVRKLSRGLKQRATLARALLHDPEFILLDEPFTGLDAASVSQLEALMRLWPEQGKTVVFSTHQFAQGAGLASRLVSMAAGRVKYDGPMQGAPLNELGIQ